VKGKGAKGKNDTKTKATAGGGSGKRFLIKVSDFVPMAEMIANNTEEVPVPFALSKLCHRAIQTRRKVVTWFQARSAGEEAESNERHHHFITVLEDSF
jgi:hypothetical protein